MNPIEFEHVDPSVDPPPSMSGSGYGIYVHAANDWLRSRETYLAVLVFRTSEDASAHLASQSVVHGVVTPFEWR